MLDIIPSAEEMITLVGESLYDVWNKLDAYYHTISRWDRFLNRKVIIKIQFIELADVRGE